MSAVDSPANPAVHNLYDTIRALVSKVPWHDELDLFRHLENINVAEFGEDGRYPVPIPAKAAAAPEPLSVDAVATAVLSKLTSLLEAAGVNLAPVAPAEPAPGPAPEPAPAPLAPPAAAFPPPPPPAPLPPEPVPPAD